MKSPDYLKWKEEFSVSIHELDEEHKEMFGIINSLYNEILQGKVAENIREHLTRMSEYAKRHFTHEEKVMQGMSFPRYEFHRRMHSVYRSKVNEFARDLQKNIDVSHDLFTFLKNWWQEHIVEMDSEYGVFFRTTTRKNG